MSTIASTLSINQIYLVIFEKTKQPFVTEDGDVFVFLTEEDSREFLKTNPGTTLQGPQYFAIEDLSSLCYGAGGTKIRVKVPGKNQERIEDLTKMPIKKYYNFKLNQALNLLHETKKKKYLYEMSDKKFIVPIKINTGKDIVIEYGIARSGDKKFFLAFSNLDEFDNWSKLAEGYSPIEISYDELVELCGSDDCVLNVAGTRYMLSQDKMNTIRIEMARIREEKEA